MKKINYPYFIFITFMWAAADMLAGILENYSLWWLLLLPVYGIWYVCSPVIFYIINKRKGVKNGFNINYCLEALYATFWIDTIHKELAYICLLNPFTIKYIPLNLVDNAGIEISYEKDKKYIMYIKLYIHVTGKKYKFLIEIKRRFSPVNAETYGKRLINMTQEFVDILNMP